MTLYDQYNIYNCYAGVGKTYFIRQKKLPNLPHYVIIAMNETFSVKNAIQKLSELSGCENSGVFFSFTINDPGVSFIASVMSKII